MSSPPRKQLVMAENEVEENAAQPSDQATALVKSAKLTETDSSPEIESPVRLLYLTAERLWEVSETAKKKMKNKKKQERKKRKKAAARVAGRSTLSVDSWPEMESPISLRNSTSEQLGKLSEETERRKMKNKKNKERKKRKKAAARVACSSTHTVAPTVSGACVKSTESEARIFEKGEGSKAAKEKRTSPVLMCRNMTASTFRELTGESLEESPKTMAEETREGLRQCITFYEGKMIGTTVAATDQTADPLNLNRGKCVQFQAIMDLIEERWDDLIGEMPLKISYPASEGDKLRTITGCDPKNTRWSYYDGGSWPSLLWTSAVECGTQVTATLPPAASGTLPPARRPELEKGGASSGKRRREDSDDGGDQVHHHRVWVERDLHPKNIAEGALAVFWKNVDDQCALLGVIQGVQQMVHIDELQLAVNRVLNEHHCPTERTKYFYSHWTDGGITVLFRRIPWSLFKTAVRGVIVAAVEGDPYMEVGAVEEGAEEGDYVVGDGPMVSILWIYFTGRYREIGTVVGPMSRIEFVNAVDDVLGRQDLPLNRVKHFVSTKNRMSMTVLFRRVPWERLRAEVRWVLVMGVEGDPEEVVADNS